MDVQGRRPAYVTLEGELDIFRKDDVRAALPDPAAVSSVVLNCSRCTYVDSAMMGALVVFRRDFVKAGGDPANFVLVVARNSVVHRAFEIAGLTKLFGLAFTEAEARLQVRKGVIEP